MVLLPQLMISQTCSLILVIVTRWKLLEKKWMALKSFCEVLAGYILLLYAGCRILCRLDCLRRRGDLFLVGRVDGALGLSPEHEVMLVLGLGRWGLLTIAL